MTPSTRFPILPHKRAAFCCKFCSLSLQQLWDVCPAAANAAQLWEPYLLHGSDAGSAMEQRAHMYRLKARCCDPHSCT